MNQKPGTFDLVVLIGVVIALAAFFLVKPAPSEQSTAADEAALGTVAVTETTRPEATPTNANRSADGTGSVGAVSVTEVTTQAARYHGQSVCIRGFYQQSFEFSALGAKRPPESITPPFIWVEAKVLGQELTCSTTDAGQQVCRGDVTVCGVFEYSAVPKFGHVGAYQYQLR